MAALGAQVSCFLSAGLISIFIFILLAVFVTALCSDCTRRSFELQDRQVDKNPSTLIRVVKLEEVHENPTITEIQKDESEFHPAGETATCPSQSQQGEPQIPPDSLVEEETSAGYTPWTSHLMAPQSKGVNGSSPSHSNIYQTTGGGRSNSSDALSPPTNQKPVQQQEGGDARLAARMKSSECDRNSVYARISKKQRLIGSPAHTSEEEKEEEKEESPPLPDRTDEME